MATSRNTYNYNSKQANQMEQQEQFLVKKYQEFKDWMQKSKNDHCKLYNHINNLEKHSL